MTSAQRLRLVLTLGVINILLAGVALGVGISESTNPPIAVVQPTPGIATPGGPGPGTAGPSSTPAPTPASTSRPSPSEEPGEPPSPQPSSSPVVEPTPSAPVEPSPSVEPVPSVAPSSGPVVALAPSPRPVSGGASTGGSNGGPKPRPTPTVAPTPAPAVGAPRTCHASVRGVERSDGKACTHKTKTKHGDNGHHRGRNAHTTRTHGHHETAAVEQHRRDHKSLHRLRPGRRAR